MKDYATKITQKTALLSTSTKIIISFVIIVLLAIVVSVYLTNKQPLQALGEKPNITAPKPKAKQNINKPFTFPLGNEQNQEIGKIAFTIENAELQNEILLKGERAHAITGKTFLIVNLKLKNDSNQAIQMDTRNYIRLLTNKKEELLAPDIHNDPVQIQAISTKYTRVGFPISETDKDLILQIGEINGEKQKIPLNLSK